MSTDVDRGHIRSLEGIDVTGAKWNLSIAALCEEAVRRQEGLIAEDGPLACSGSREGGLRTRAIR